MKQFICRCFSQALAQSLKKLSNFWIHQVEPQDVNEHETAVQAVCSSSIGPAEKGLHPADALLKELSSTLWHVKTFICLSFRGTILCESAM